MRISPNGIHRSSVNKGGYIDSNIKASLDMAETAFALKPLSFHQLTRFNVFKIMLMLGSYRNRKNRTYRICWPVHNVQLAIIPTESTGLFIMSSWPSYLKILQACSLSPVGHHTYRICWLVHNLQCPIIAYDSTGLLIISSCPS